MYTLLIWTSHFSRSARKFIQRYPDLKKKFAHILCDLEQDPLQPSLRLHPLSGELKGLRSISVTYSYRITLILKVTQREIILLDMESHDEVYD